MKSLDGKFTRRNLLKVGGKGISALTLLPLLTACKTLIPVNTAEGFREGVIDISEESFEMQKVGIFGENYFIVPLNTETEILQGGEPSFALIPEKRSRVSTESVGEEGGKVTVDAPEGDIYFPHVLVVERDDKGKIKERKIIPKFKDIKPVRLRTNFYMKDASTPEEEDGKISLQNLSEEEFPFSDEVLKTSMGNGRYIINKAEDAEKLPEEEKLIPIYFSRLPVKIEYDRTKDDRKIRISGPTFLFKKGKSIGDYKTERGFLKTGVSEPTAATDEEAPSAGAE